jgi:hypothetical protein
VRSGERRMEDRPPNVPVMDRLRRRQHERLHGLPGHDIGDGYLDAARENSLGGGMDAPGSIAPRGSIR